MIVAALKFLHIAALLVWCAALLALPFQLRLHRAATTSRQVQTDFTRMRLLSHTTYTLVATPAAVIAISTGTGLLFLERVMVPWFLAKLFLVAGMALTHAWLGHLLLQSGERGPGWRMPQPMIAPAIAVPLMAGVLWLVLAKPPLYWLEEMIPDWASAPVARDMPAYGGAP